MIQNREETDEVEHGLNRFEKNNYFHGKLMTARDMQAEQDYHVGKQHTLARFVVGEGIVFGLNVIDVRERDDQLEVTVADGVALDSYGRPIVVKGAESVPVENTGADQSSISDVDEIYLSIRYNEIDRESVPVPSSESAHEGDCAPNRFLETFDIIYDTNAPEYKSVSPIEFPDEDDVHSRSTDDPALDAIAKAYHDDRQHEIRDDPSLFLGAFERDRHGDWKPMEPDRRSHVYTNDMLYAAIARHVTDFDNPHKVTSTRTPDGITERLEAFERYIVERSLQFTIRSFSNVEERFDAGIASQIVDTTRAAIDDGVFEDRDNSFRFLDGVPAEERELVRELEDDVTSDSLDRYEEAVDELDSVLNEERDVLRVAVAQDVVCETANLLRRKRPRVLKASREVPDLVGRSKEEAEEMLVEDDWMFTIEEREGRDRDRDVDVNHVVAQTPEPGKELYIRHRVVRLEVRVPVRLQGDQGD